MDLIATGARIKARRIELGLTQQKLAQKVSALSSNLSQAALNKIEKGGATSRLFDIAEALEISVLRLAYADDIPKYDGYWPFKISRLEDFEQLKPSKKEELDQRLADFIAGAL
ncbi:helix-turn-helix domain-containing protein [Bordetella sp. FB-8]|uniref:helix-turn-helix domain-containing protein n=1 Tax=Bordetella sp. FB-8 TaxID=1159870 RepID=UPI00036D1591|nr:helix-turn-helix transcriptional regulator [Bordetella sp. FB-8]